MNCRTVLAIFLGVGLQAGLAAPTTDAAEALRAGAARQRQTTLAEVARWEGVGKQVESLMVVPSREGLAAAKQIVMLLRAELVVRDALLKANLDVVAAGGAPAQAVHFSRPYNDLTAETVYAQRMIGLLAGQLEGAEAETKRLSALGEGWKRAAGEDLAKIARIDRWIVLMHEEVKLLEACLELYADQDRPGWYDRANLVAKYDLPILKARSRGARTAIDAGESGSLLAAQSKCVTALLAAGKATTQAMGAFNAMMTRETPLVVDPEILTHSVPGVPDPTRPQAAARQTVPVPEKIWDMVSLAKQPEYRWLDEKGAVRQLLYRGEPYQGKPTDVFAYYASPGTLVGDPALDKDLPALVLVHGGGDRAFRDWVVFWAKHGYAAIAMDLAGCGPDAAGEYDKLYKPNRLLRGGPCQDGKRKILDTNLPVTDQWPYHAVANVILAHSWIRGLPGVDAERTGVAGISWGGYTTCIAAGVDSRFKAAMPFYGCGFLAENSVWKEMKLFEQLGEERAQLWTRLWDPSRYAGKIKMPIFCVTGAKDFAYPLESFGRTYALTNGPRVFRITPDMGHGAQFLTRTPEAVVFMDSVLRGGRPLPSLREPRVGTDTVTVEVTAGKIATATFHYTTAAGPSKTREWVTVDATVEDGTVAAPLPPAKITIGYFAVTDDHGHRVSSAPFTGYLSSN